jgi:hypothetical protein
MKVLATALSFMLVSAVKAGAQQYDYITSLQPSLTNSVVTIKAGKAPPIGRHLPRDSDDEARRAPEP